MELTNIIYMNKMKKKKEDFQMLKILIYGEIILDF